MKEQKLLIQCCVCKKWKRKEGFKFTDRKHLDEWGHHHEDLKELQKMFDVMFTHSYCDVCYKKAMEELDVWFKREGTSGEKPLHDRS